MKNKGFLSPEEKRCISKRIDSYQVEKIKIETWKDMVKNREYYLREYIIYLKEKYLLDKGEYFRLESTIRIGVSSDFFNEETIVIEDGKITEIKNLVWDPEQRLFSIEIENYKHKKKWDKKNSAKIVTNYTLDTSNDINFFNTTKWETDLKIDKKWDKFLETVLA